MPDLFGQYKGLYRSFRLYWRAYGGTKALLLSPYLHTSVVLAVLLHPLWGVCSESPWYEITVTVLPNLLGFTLGGYAILMAFGDDKFRERIAGEDDDGKPSPFMVVNSAFIHFILIQMIAILLSLFGKAVKPKGDVLSFFGMFFFVYALLTALAAGFAVLNIADWFDVVAKRNRDAKRKGYE